MRISVLVGVVVVALSGCGSDDTPAPPDKQDALNLAADYLNAVSFGDEEAACALLTEEAREHIVSVVAKIPNVPEGSDCVEALAGILPDGGVPGPELDPEDPASDVRAGQPPVEVSFEAGRGEVVISSDLTFPIQDVDGEWRIDNGAGPLFSFGAPRKAGEGDVP